MGIEKSQSYETMGIEKSQSYETMGIEKSRPYETVGIKKIMSSSITIKKIFTFLRKANIAFL